jgi:hypothetical protein
MVDLDDLEKERLKAQVKAWLVIRFTGSWWTPNYESMGLRMINSCNIQTQTDLDHAIERGALEVVIDLYLQKMTELVKSTGRSQHIDER